MTDPSLKTSVGLAPWEPVGRNIKVLTLLMCGSIDAVANDRDCLVELLLSNRLTALEPRS